jgi:hypothetical protein
MVAEIKITSDFEGFKKEFEFLSMDYKRFFLEHTLDVLDTEFKKGFPRDFRAIVDGVPDKKLIDVKPFGNILFINTQTDLKEAFVAAYEAILARSPMGGPKRSFPGIKYKDFNWISLNDNVVARNISELQTQIDFNALRPGDVITFINIVPYARKLERFGIMRGRETGPRVNKRKGRKIRVNRKGTFEVPNGAYQGAQRIIRALFKGKAKVSNVKYRPQLIKIGGMTSTFQTQGKFGGIGRPYLYPVIDITIQEGGFKGL